VGGPPGGGVGGSGARLVKAQCIRSYGFLKAWLHMVGSYIQMQLFIGRLPSCQLFSIFC